ncbi:M56 family metallopeptidase [Segetibacter aerophilus]|uniref:Peptidase M56 domain-containing protein n=1 Tax=Segetibacter aerophilus TaxID=670293 RepID=A0A512B6Y6_9BACT|nr:M56 family metallopeptidase [Segetibacter aerophilus]GEO07719.1 hypothetical protein SAE01_02150 [Segetibacter aerophilus]
MPVYFEYALKVSISLAIVFLFYTLLLKRMTYYRWNRYFLLASSLLSLVVPFINVSVFIQPKEQSVISLVNEIPSIHAIEIGAESNNAGMVVYWQIVSVVFLLVSIALVFRLLVQFFSIQKIKAQSTVVAIGDDIVYNIPQQILPFSFLDNIFINVNNYSEKELHDILKHERIHVQEKHSLDMLVLEIICVLNWYNPFAWMIKKAVRENLEFIADDAVVTRGVDRKSYQYLLLKVTGEIPSSIASSLKFSSLKTRIIMMNKSKTSQLHLLKFSLLVPMVVVLLLAFRNSKEVAPKTDKVASVTTETFTLSTLTYSIPDEKVKAIVVQEKDKSLLKPGELLNLTLIQNEKDRLKSLLEKNGYINLKSNAIRFMIDTASVANSFSIEVKINLEPGIAAIKRKDAISIRSYGNDPKLNRFYSLDRAMNMENESRFYTSSAIQTFI